MSGPGVAQQRWLELEQSVEELEGAMKDCIVEMDSTCVHVSDISSKTR